MHAGGSTCALSSSPLRFSLHAQLAATDVHRAMLLVSAEMGAQNMQSSTYFNMRCVMFLEDAGASHWYRLVTSAVQKRLRACRVLWLLSTRLGTLLLCGPACITQQFPYVQRFSDLPAGRVERILHNWLRAWLRWKRVLCRALRGAAMLSVVGEASASCLLV
jgi:hypothetical protein